MVFALLVPNASMHLPNMSTNEQPGIEILRGEPLAPHCRFNVGGHADFFCEVSSASQLAEALTYAEQNSLRHFVYAGGSNIFFDDAGFRGLVIRFVDGGFKLNLDNQTISVSAGYELPSLARELAQHDLGGIEFLGNIPGSIGGAVVGNAGCYGKNIASVLLGAEVMDANTHEVSTVDPGFFKFAYRHSKLKNDQSILVVRATLQLTSRPGVEILDELAAELEIRLKKHPHQAACAGSFFKNESRDNPAWLLISEAGMSEATEGGAALSDMHANFLINQGGATSKDIIRLTRKIRSAVKKMSGCDLVPEVRYINPFGIAEIGE